MAAVSYVISQGGVLESVTTGTNAPSSGSVELRMDQTATAITDGNAPGGTRALKKGEIQQILRILEEYLIRDTSISQ